MDNLHVLRPKPVDNSAVIKILEDALALAKSGDVVGVALVMRHTGGRTGTAYDSPVWYRLLFLAALIAGFIYNFTSGSHMAGFGYGLGAGFGTIWATEEVVKLYRTYKKHREV